MSGGSYDYLFHRISDAARRLMRSGEKPYRKAFGQLLLKCSEAMHDIEWVDSDDYESGDDEEAIMKCLTHASVLQVSLEDAKKVMSDLKHYIEKCEKK